MYIYPSSTRDYTAFSPQLPTSFPCVLIHINSTFERYLVAQHIRSQRLECLLFRHVL